MRKVILVLLFPIIALIWIVGWALYHVGSTTQQTTTTKPKTTEDDEDLEIVCMLDEEQTALQDS